MTILITYSIVNYMLYFIYVHTNPTIMLKFDEKYSKIGLNLHKDSQIDNFVQIGNDLMLLRLLSAIKSIKNAKTRESCCQFLWSACSKRIQRYEKHKIPLHYVNFTMSTKMSIL